MIKKARILFARAARIIDEEGFGTLLKYIRQTLCSYASYTILESALDIPEIKDKVANLEVKLINTGEELERLADNFEDEGFDFPRDKEIVKKGATLLAAFVGGELAHITQVFDGEQAHTLYPFAFAMPYGRTVGMAAFTAERYRRRGIHLYTRVRALGYLKESGASRAWDVQDKNNIAARDSLLKIGYYLWGTGYQLRLFTLLAIGWVRPVSKILPGKIRCRLR